MKKTGLQLLFVAAFLLSASEWAWGQIIPIGGSVSLFYESQRDGITQIYRMDRIRVFRFVGGPPPDPPIIVRETRISDTGFEYRYPSVYSTWVQLAPRMILRSKAIIAYASKRGDNWNIYTSESNGTNESTARASSPEAKRNLGWTPDGKWISYIQGTKIYKVNANGVALTPQTCTPGEVYEIVGHGWLDNETIIYFRMNPGNPGMYQYVKRRCGSGSFTALNLVTPPQLVITSGKAGGLIICEPLKAVDSGAT